MSITDAYAESYAEDNSRFYYGESENETANEYERNYEIGGMYFNDFLTELFSVH